MRQAPLKSHPHKEVDREYQSQPGVRPPNQTLTQRGVPAQPGRGENPKVVTLLPVFLVVEVAWGVALVDGEPPIAEKLGHPHRRREHLLVVDHLGEPDHSRVAA